MIRITLPYPPAELNPNRKMGKHWGVTDGMKKKLRNDCWYLTLHQARGLVLPDGDLPIIITFVYSGLHRPDADNLLASFKAGLDGMCKALKFDDSRFEPLLVRRERGPAPGCVWIDL